MANPILNNNFTEQERVLQGEPMSINGAINATGFLGVVLLLSAVFSWTRFTAGYTDMAMMLTKGGAIAGFVLAMIIVFAARTNKYLISAYAACEGLVLGGISAVFEASIPGIVAQAVAGTFAALFAMLILYKANVIRCTEKFRSVIIIATASIAVVYLIDLIGGFFGYHVPLINSSSAMGIAVTAIVVVIAALNLIIDFDFIERGAQSMLPKEYEWYGAFGLMITLVWLYLEILRLLAKLNDRR